MKTSSRVLINSATSWLTSGINASVGIVLVPYLIGKFGRDGYGLVSLVGVIVALTSVADMGLRGSLGRQLAAKNALGDEIGFNNLVSSAIAVYLCLGIFLSMALIAFSAQIAAVFRITDALTDTAILLIRWYGTIACLVTFMSTIFGAVLISINRFDTLNFIQAGVGILRGGLIFSVLVFTELGLIGWALAMTISHLLGLLGLRAMALRLCPFICFQRNYVHWDSITSLFAVGSYVFVLQLTNLLSVRADPIIITSILGTSALALYAPVTSLTGAIRPLVDTLTNQLHPLATGYHVNDESERLRLLLTRGTRYTFLMGIPVCVILAVYAEAICYIWLGDKLGADYLIVARVLLYWSVVDFLYYSGGAQYPTLLGMNRLKFLVWVQGPLAVVNVVGSALLVMYSSLGVVGVVFPSIIVGLIMRPIISIYTARQVGMSGRAYFHESYLGPFVVTGLMVLWSWILLMLIAPNDLMALVVCVMLSALAWAGLCWVIGFNAEDRVSFRNLPRSFWARSAQ